MDALTPLKEHYAQGRKRPTHYTFETLRRRIEEDRERFWQDVLSMHAQVLGWFGDLQLHNKLGFLVACGTGFEKLWEWVDSGGMTKSCFNDQLNRRICSTLDITESALRELGYDKEKDHSKLHRVLLLLNVETASRCGQRFPFREHVGKVWSLEHIHAQNAQGLTTKEQWGAWLTEHGRALSALSDAADLLTEIDELVPQLKTDKTENNLGNKFRDLSERIIDKLTRDRMVPEDGLHAIDNLALLSRDDNSRLSNAVFAVKRRAILDIDRAGGYIPICTRNVFLKYYSEEDAQQMHFWGQRDRDGYFGAIVQRVKIYLKPEGANL